MKQLIITTLAISFGIMFFFYRRRLKLAVQVAGGLYIGLTLIRFVFYQDDADRFTDLGLVLAVLGAVWLVVNLITHLVLRRRQRRARS